MACGPRPGPPFFAGASPPCLLVWQGSWDSPGRQACPAARGSTLRGGGGPRGVLPGGVAGGPSGAGGRPTSVRPSAFPRQATKRVPLASLWVQRAWPPYCSGSCSRMVPGCDPCVVLMQLSRPPWEQAVWGVGARGVRAQLRPPPPRASRPLRGEGGRPPCPGGLEGRCPRCLLAGGGSGG